tara:strand:+ start:577 stop:765 length:189 start_codon:yes stop_codon:yes gene_type:complete
MNEPYILLNRQRLFAFLWVVIFFSLALLFDILGGYLLILKWVFLVMGALSIMQLLQMFRGGK